MPKATINSFHGGLVTARADHLLDPAEASEGYNWVIQDGAIRAVDLGDKASVPLPDGTTGPLYLPTEDITPFTYPIKSGWPVSQAAYTKITNTWPFMDNMGNVYLCTADIADNTCRFRKWGPDGTLLANINTGKNNERSFTLGSSSAARGVHWFQIGDDVFVMGATYPTGLDQPAPRILCFVGGTLSATPIIYTWGVFRRNGTLWTPTGHIVAPHVYHDNKHYLTLGDAGTFVAVFDTVNHTISGTGVAGEIQTPASYLAAYYGSYTGINGAFMVPDPTTGELVVIVADATVKPSIIRLNPIGLTPNSTTALNTEYKFGPIDMDKTGRIWLASWSPSTDGNAYFRCLNGNDLTAAFSWYSNAQTPANLIVDNDRNLVYWGATGGWGTCTFAGVSTVYASGKSSYGGRMARSNNGAIVIQYTSAPYELYYMTPTGGLNIGDERGFCQWNNTWIKGGLDACWAQDNHWLYKTDGGKVPTKTDRAGNTYRLGGWGPSSEPTTALATDFNAGCITHDQHEYEYRVTYYSSKTGLETAPSDAVTQSSYYAYVDDNWDTGDISIWSPQFALPTSGYLTIEGEVIHYTAVSDMGGGRWKLTGVTRGCRETLKANHVNGDPIYLADGRIVLSNLPVCTVDPQLDKKRIYRLYAGQHRLVAEISMATTTFTDDVAAESLGIVLDTDGDLPPLIETTMATANVAPGNTSITVPNPYLFRVGQAVVLEDGSAISDPLPITAITGTTLVINALAGSHTYVTPHVTVYPTGLGGVYNGMLWLHDDHTITWTDTDNCDRSDGGWRMSIDWSIHQMLPFQDFMVALSSEILVNLSASGPGSVARHDVLATYGVSSGRGAADTGEGFLLFLSPKGVCLYDGHSVVLASHNLAAEPAWSEPHDWRAAWWNGRYLLCNETGTGVLAGKFGTGQGSVWELWTGCDATGFEKAPGADKLYYRSAADKYLYELSIVNFEERFLPTTIPATWYYATGELLMLDRGTPAERHIEFLTLDCQGVVSIGLTVDEVVYPYFVLPDSLRSVKRIRLPAWYRGHRVRVRMEGANVGAVRPVVWGVDLEFSGPCRMR